MALFNHITLPLPNEHPQPLCLCMEILVQMLMNKVSSLTNVHEIHKTSQTAALMTESEDFRSFWSVYSKYFMTTLKFIMHFEIENDLKSELCDRLRKQEGQVGIVVKVRLQEPNTIKWFSLIQQSESASGWILFTVDDDIIEIRWVESDEELKNTLASHKWFAFQLEVYGLELKPSYQELSRRIHENESVISASTSLSFDGRFSSLSSIGAMNAVNVHKESSSISAATTNAALPNSPSSSQMELNDINTRNINFQKANEVSIANIQQTSQEDNDLHSLTSQTVTTSNGNYLTRHPQAINTTHSQATQFQSSQGRSMPLLSRNISHNSIISSISNPSKVEHPTELSIDQTRYLHNITTSHYSSAQSTKSSQKHEIQDTNHLQSIQQTQLGQVSNPIHDRNDTQLTNSHQATQSSRIPNGNTTNQYNPQSFNSTPISTSTGDQQKHLLIQEGAIAQTQNSSGNPFGEKSGSFTTAECTMQQNPHPAISVEALLQEIENLRKRVTELELDKKRMSITISEQEKLLKGIMNIMKGYSYNS